MELVAMLSPFRPLIRPLLLAAALGGAAVPGTAQERRAPEAADTLARAGEEPLSARGAFLRSLVLPGWGQTYVGSPGRGAVYFAMESGSLWMLYKTRRELGEARERQRFLREQGELGPRQELDLVNAREEQFEDWITLSIFVALLSAADAYVGAQLADFDEHIGVRPTRGGGLRLEAHLPVGRRQ